MRRVELWGYAGLIALGLALLLRVLVIGSGTPALGLAVLGGLLLLVYFVRAGQSVDRFLSRRSTQAGGTVFGTTLFVIGIAILVNAIGSRVGARVDLTQDRIFTVASETRAALKAAPVAPEVWVFYPENSGPAESWRTLLEGAQAADPRLKSKKLGVVAGTPPATSMVQAGLMGHVKPYQLMVDTRFSNPAEDMIKDVASGAIDVAAAWGPVAGYYAAKMQPRLTVMPLTREKAGRMIYRITMGVRASDQEWKRQLNKAISENQTEINHLLQSYGVPLLNEQDKPITD